MWAEHHYFHPGAPLGNTYVIIIYLAGQIQPATFQFPSLVFQASRTTAFSHEYSHPL